MVVDADALVDIGKVPRTPRVRVLTPHPGEMARLTGKTVAEVQADRNRHRGARSPKRI